MPPMPRGECPYCEVSKTLGLQYNRHVEKCPQRPQVCEKCGKDVGGYDLNYHQCNPPEAPRAYRSHHSFANRHWCSTCNQQTDHDSLHCPRQGHYCPECRRFCEPGDNCQHSIPGQELSIDENRYRDRFWLPRYTDFRWARCPGQPRCSRDIMTEYEHRKLCDHCFHDWRQAKPLAYEQAMQQAPTQEQGGFSLGRGRHARVAHSTLRERCTPRSRWD
ncbi:hypothetical protein T439DRAFT_327872 [Meredithblackwellia eburnea MCA 4105]